MKQTYSTQHFGIRVQHSKFYSVQVQYPRLAATAIYHNHTTNATCEHVFQQSHSVTAILLMKSCYCDFFVLGGDVQN